MTFAHSFQKLEVEIQKIYFHLPAGVMKTLLFELRDGVIFRFPRIHVQN